MNATGRSRIDSFKVHQFFAFPALARGHDCLRRLFPRPPCLLFRMVYPTLRESSIVGLSASIAENN